MKTIGLIFIVLCITNTYCQTDSLHDIRDKYIKKMFEDNPSNELDKFQNIALNLFYTGTRPDLNMLKDDSRALVGVCYLGSKSYIPLDRNLELNLYSLRYIRNIHNDSIVSDYFINFYVDYSNRKEEKIVRTAVKSYLKKIKFHLKTKHISLQKTTLCMRQQ